ncbi:MAG: flgG [Rickettsiales bacterium]|jgi:flagellar basal-body rod protein FlgG|nr:flgG [Rickettsiales bacterium]
MMRALSIAATGMQAQQLNVEVISNNIANINTTGFKRQRAEFQDLLYQNEQRVGTSSSAADTIVPTGVQIGLGVNTGAVYRINEQGELNQTENKFDVAIRGRGFFQVELPDGSFAYTRAGSFQVNGDGELVTVKGLRVSPGITIPNNTTDVTINESGEVLATIDGQIDPQNVGRIELSTFINEAGLQAIGDNFLLETAASGPAVVGNPGEEGVGGLLQGYLEASNVDPVREITSLIVAQRGYELNSKVIQAGDEMMQTANQARR